VHAFAEVNPVTIVVDAARRPTIGERHAVGPAQETLAWLGALLMIFAPLPVRAIRRAWLLARRSGWTYVGLRETTT
jgi:hypothetical protein